MIRNKALECDVPGCESRILDSGDPQSYRAARLRHQALDHGWTRDERGGDRCPNHTTQPPRASSRPSAGPPEGLSEESRRLLGLTGSMSEIQRAALEAGVRLVARGAAATPRAVADELGVLGPGAGYQRVHRAIRVLRSLGRWPSDRPGAAT
jgi:hypothetical protein